MRKSKSRVESILGISAAKAIELLDNLTVRERQIADLMATGDKNKVIAGRLGISTKTLDIHRTNVKRKLHANGPVDIARIVFAKKFGEHLD